MNSYKIYITKSFEAAQLIFRGLREATPWKSEDGETISIECGKVLEDCRIPAMYHNKGNFYALIKYRNGKDDEHSEYEIIIA